MMKVSIPVEVGNKGVKEGFLPKAIMGFVEQMKPEACYFFPEGGRRTGLFVFDLADPTMLPTATEPFFMQLNGAIEITPVMNLDDMKNGIAKLTKSA